MKFIATVCSFTLLSLAAPLAHAESYVVLSGVRDAEGRPLPIVITVDSVYDQSGAQPSYTSDVAQPIAQPPRTSSYPARPGPPAPLAASPQSRQVATSPAPPYAPPSLMAATASPPSSNMPMAAPAPVPPARTENAITPQEGTHNDIRIYASSNLGYISGYKFHYSANGNNIYDSTNSSLEFSLALGVKVFGNWRAEAQISGTAAKINSDVSSSSNPPTSPSYIASGSIGQLSVESNFYYDFNKIGFLTPYLGFGVSAEHFTFDDSTASGINVLGLGAAAMAGFNSKITPNWDLFVEAKYKYSGFSADFSNTSGGITAHPATFSLSSGLRYTF